MFLCLANINKGITMKVETAKRIHSVKEYYFSTKLREVAQLRKEGKPIINLGIGSPDMPPHESVREKMASEISKPEGHGYQSYSGIPELREAFSRWYQRQYSVEIDPEEDVLPLIGSKEGIMHISMAFLDPGDEVLVPNPGYPTYQSATRLAGGVNRPYILKEEKDWMPDFDALEEEDLSRVKLMWVNYPHMPTGARGKEELWKRLVDFGKKNNILICHDNPYSFILNPQPSTIFSVEGARDCCLELNSLSKSHNMAGWRIGAVVGSPKFLKEVIKFKSNMDSGMNRAAQLAAAVALDLDDDWYDSLNEVYHPRKKIAYQILEELGCDYQKEQAGLFAWGKVPDTVKDGYELSDRALYEANVFITPGGIFGSGGDQYIRISVCSGEEELMEALERVKGLVNDKIKAQ